MSNSVFPSQSSLPGLKWDINKVPTFNTAVQKAVGGREVRAAFQPYPIWRWTLAFEFLRETTGFSEFKTLAGFFTARQGRFDSFLYEDPSDYLIADTSPSTRQIFGTGDAATTGFQLGRSLGTSGLFEPIYNLHATPKIYVNDVLKSTPGDYSVSATGVVTFVSAPAAAAVLTWSGTYYWRVRFGDDSADFNNFANLFWNAKQISLEQLLGL